MKNKKDKLDFGFYTTMNAIGIVIGLILAFMGQSNPTWGIVSWILKFIGIILVFLCGILMTNLFKLKEKLDNESNEKELADIPSKVSDDSEVDRDAEIERLKAELSDANAKIQEYESVDTALDEFEEYAEEDDLEQEGE